MDRYAYCNHGVVTNIRASFEPGDWLEIAWDEPELIPGGNDYGVSLSELADGEYALQIAAYNYYEPVAGEVGFDCWVIDSRENLYIIKNGNSISIQSLGSISSVEATDMINSV